MAKRPFYLPTFREKSTYFASGIIRGIFEKSFTQFGVLEYASNEVRIKADNWTKKESFPQWKAPLLYL
ncbi:hypothetical protein [Sphingobacterium mizutaii]|uniref:hypothetical protein n=1 Tax=Sphingobacterium mizutaii TaxID=1010 RepID=UPI0016277087|nr:hypothetical protein [Sphingobacterium mizutaii]